MMLWVFVQKEPKLKKKKKKVEVKGSLTVKRFFSLEDFAFILISKQQANGQNWSQ